MLAFNLIACVTKVCFFGLGPSGLLGDANMCCMARLPQKSLPFPVSYDAQSGSLDLTALHVLGVPLNGEMGAALIRGLILFAFTL